MVNIAYDFDRINFCNQTEKICEFSIWCPHIICEESDREMVAIFVNVFYHASDIKWQKMMAFITSTGRTFTQT